MTVPAAERERVPVFRRRRFSAPHRQRGLWLRLLRPLAAAVMIVGLPAAGAFWIATSPVFRVEELAVSSAGRVSVSVAQQRLAALRGRHVLLVRLEDVEAALGEQQWLRGVEISKQLPSRLEVRLLERRSVALLRAQEGLFFLDRRGEVIAPYDPQWGDGDYVLVVAHGRGPAAIRGALALAETWARNAGPWAAGLSEVEIVGATSYRVHAADLDFPVLVTHEHLQTGLEALRRHLPTINRYYSALEVADLRFSGQIVFQPAAELPREG